MSTKRIIAVFVLCVSLFVSCSVLFADSTTAKSGQFLLSHNLGVAKKYYLEFYDLRASTAFGEDGVSFQDFGDYTRFVRVNLYYNSNITCQSISVSVSNLTMDVSETVGDQVNTTTYTLKYSMTVYKGSSSTVLTYTQSSEYGAGSVVLVENKQYTRAQQTQQTEVVNLAEFSISIKESENESVLVGTYSGTMTIFQEVT